MKIFRLMLNGELLKKEKGPLKFQQYLPNTFRMLKALQKNCLKMLKCCHYSPPGCVDPYSAEGRSVW